MPHASVTKKENENVLCIKRLFFASGKNILGVIVVIAVVVLQRCKGYQL
jgi:hypothetical protein